MTFERKGFGKAVALLTIALVGLSAGAALAGYLGSGYFPTRYLDWAHIGTGGSYTSPINAAMSKWTSTTDLQFTKIYTNYWDIAQYVSYQGATGWAGLAYICSTNGYCNNSTAWNSTYSYCVAYENQTYQDGYSSTCKQAVAGHEAGHCVSLAHNSNTSSIMYTYVASTCDTTPNSGDISDVNARY